MQQAGSKRRISRNLLSAESDNDSEISIDESNSGISDSLHCSICQKIFVEKAAHKKHEWYCRKRQNMYDPLANGQKVEAKTSTALSNGNVDYGASGPTDPTCLDVLSKMEAHCPKCKEESKMKPNDTNCLKCKSKLMLSCVKCCKVFADFLSIFNHLYKDCSGKQYHCARCVFATPSLDIMQAHVLSDHTETSADSSVNEKSNESPFVFAAQAKAAAISKDVKLKLKVAYKTRAQSRVKPKGKAATRVTTEDESKLKKCPRCNVKTYSLIKHLITCKAELRCPFCAYKSKAKYILKQHLDKCHSSKSHTAKYQAVFNEERMLARPDIQDLMRSYCKSCDELDDSLPFKLKCTTCQTKLEYRCIKCQATFAVREKLRKHVWCHRNSSKYSFCTGCTKSFASITNLRMHEKVCSALVSKSN